ncbi:MAG TPA: RagB/SusD family nutrient uptake outer membrane protein [Cyclobacteriaceae bacterium]|jgi:tetratricopeptide (TPR) repeat protein|nr:RagB/SusD family nutrient uptake outer membrane protein [Cyclobacteriaceae bacterium]
MKKLLLSITVIAILLTTGCSDKFLDTQNQNELNPDNYFSTIQNFEYALTGTYDAVKNLDLFGQTFYIQTLLAMPHESDYWNAQNRNAVTSTDGNVYIAWRGLYRIVTRANDLIEHSDGFSKYSPTSADAARLVQIVGEAKFLRAYAYFTLVRLWGEGPYATDSTKLAVPLNLKVAKTFGEIMNPRATVGEVYNQVIKDFKDAEAVLPDTWDNSNIARVNKYAAKGLLGQVYLYMEKYPQSKSYFEELINNSSYGLVPFSQYKDLFQGKHEFSKESVWELNYTIDMSQNIWENGLGSGIALVIAPLGRGWSNCTPHGVNIERFGSDPRLKICTIAPTDSLIDASGAMTQAGKSTFNKTGHSFKKYVPLDYCILSTNRDSGINYFIMRMADVYLMYAEVMNNLSNDGVALEYTNKVRRRAYGFDSNTPTPSDFASLSGTQLRDSIREERFRELFAEGHRWYDIVRWKIVKEEVEKYNVLNVTQGPILYRDRIYYYPVPLQEVDNNKNVVPSTDY